MNTKTVFFTGTLLLWSLYCIFVGYRELWGAHTDTWSSTRFHCKKKRKELLLCTFIIEGLFS